jgi:hypothetical protein
MRAMLEWLGSRVGGQLATMQIVAPDTPLLASPVEGEVPRGARGERKPTAA